jgi:adenine-specific DNA-methyltransferase
MSIEKLMRPARLDEERIKALKALFPECVTDGMVDFETLRESLEGNLAEVEPGEEHYGLQWPGKKTAKRLAMRPATKTLMPLHGEGVDETTSKNLIIEGDNLEVLRVLAKSYAGRVKLIYIDPPYNTGHDFVYQDDFKESSESYLEKTAQADTEGALTSNPRTSGRFHSRWLDMIYPRLRLAHTLLKRDGVIFISIDDNELQALRMICDEIFGEENFISTVVWQKKYATANDTIDFSYVHEYIVCYAKERNYTESGRMVAILNRMERTEANNAAYKNPNDDPRGPWRPDNYTCNKTAEQRPNLYYPIIHPKTGVEIFPSRTAVWRYSKDSHKLNEQEDRIWWGITQDNQVPAYKRFLSDVGGVVANTWWEHEEVGHTDEAKKEFRALFPEAGDAFDTPKPVRLLKRILQLGTIGIRQENSESLEPDLIMDFFAGSGTTGQAVLEANRDDGAERRFILVQVDEAIREGTEALKTGIKTIADVTKQRITRVAQKLKSAGAIGDLGFRVLKLANSNILKWRNLEGQSLEMLEGQLALGSTLVPGWKRENVLTEIMLLEGYPLDSLLEQNPEFIENLVYTATHPELGTRLHLCLDPDPLAEATVDAVAKFEGEVFVCLETALTDQIKVRLTDSVTVKTF